MKRKSATSSRNIISQVGVIHISIAVLVIVILSLMVGVYVNTVQKNELEKQVNAQGPRQTAGGYIYNISVLEKAPTEVTINWKTERPSTSQVLYDYVKADSLGMSTLEDTNFVTDHTVTVTGLTNGDRYQFAVRSRDLEGNYVSATNIFRTPRK